MSVGGEIMATAAVSEPVGMEKPELKKMLRLARKKPMRAAFALDGQGKAIIVLHKRKQPRALAKDLKDQAPDSKNHRFGMVHIDPENPKVACFTVNKAAGGMARKLVIALKGTGCPKVQIILDDGTPLEAAEGEPEEDQEDQEDGQQLDDDDDDEDSADAADDADQDHADAHAQDPGSDATDAAPTDPAASASGQPDAAALSQTLTGLVRQMMAVIAQDPSQKAGLAELATDVQACLKRGDLAQAAAGLEVLRQAIESAGAGPANNGPAPAASSGASPAQDPADIPITASQGAANSAPTSDASATKNGAPASGQDAAGLMAALTSVVKQLMPIVSADPSQRDAVKDIVTQAQTSLKGGDLGTASGHLDNLRAMLDGAGAQAQTAPTAPAAGSSAAPGNGAAATFTKSRLVWLAARKKVDGDINKLHDEFMGVLKDHAKADDIGSAFRKRVGGVMDTLDESLAHKLDEMAKNTDASQHPKLVQDAKQLIQNYQSFLANEPLIARLDNNPFTPLAIEKTMTATLSALDKALS
jgi:hypothetical protein